MKQKNGITLIALIITIIVLLILAGVVLNMTMGNDGIISKAQEAVDTYKNAQYQEEQMLNNIANHIKDKFVTENIHNKGLNAESIIKNIQDGTSISEYAGMEVEYLTYTRADGTTTSNLWKIVYVGKNIDNQISEMNTQENRIFIIPKYYMTSLAASSQSLEVSTGNNIITVSHTNGGYATRQSFIDDMRNPSKWSALKGNQADSVAIGGPTLAQWNMINDWGGYSSMIADELDAQYTMQSLNFWYLSECDAENNYNLVNSTGDKQYSNENTWLYNWGIRPLVMLGANATINFTEETANSILEKIEDGTPVSSFAGKEIKYIKYKRADNNTISDEWKIVYVGKNIDNQISEMNTQDNRIFIIPKYFTTSLVASSQQIVINVENNIVNVETTNRGYTTRQSFIDDMRNPSKWSAFTIANTNSVAIGGPTLTQWNMINDWGGYSSMVSEDSDAQYTIESQGSWYLAECSATNYVGLINSTGNTQGSNEHTWTYNWGIRPLVMLQSNATIQFITGHI